jgi:hypothetical protein
MRLLVSRLLIGLLVSGCVGEKFQKFLEDLEFVWHGCCTVQWALPSWTNRSESNWTRVTV